MRLNENHDDRTTEKLARLCCEMRGLDPEHLINGVPQWKAPSNMDLIKVIKSALGSTESAKILLDAADKIQAHSADPIHKCWSVCETNYRPGIDNDAPAFAIHYEAPPKQTEQGTSMGMIYPILLVTEYLKDQRETGHKIAEILNQHWVDD